MKAFHDSQTWQGASDACVAMGYRLARIMNPERNAGIVENNFKTIY